MSRPHGLPKRPGNSLHDSSHDTYRPPPPPSDQYRRRAQHNQDGPARNDDMYQFRGNAYPREDESRSYYRDAPGSQHERDRYLRDNDYQRRSNAVPLSNSRSDTYRPPPAEFSFRHNPPPAIELNEDYHTYRPRSPKASNHNSNHSNGPSAPRSQSNRQANRHGGYGGYGGFPRKTAERPFLKTNRAPTPELMRGMEEDEATGTKFRPLEELSDSEEADMDVSSDEEGYAPPEIASPDQPKIKQARTETVKPGGDSVPRWSNPDPYTALPPPDDSQRKKKDVVKLIRKARVAPQSSEVPKSDAAADDFISFDLQDEEEDDESDIGTSTLGVPGAPTGPKSQTNRPMPLRTGSENKSGKPKVTGIAGDPALGNRKRTIDDIIKGPPLFKKPTPSKRADGTIVSDWRVVKGCNSTPWCQIDHSATENTGFWLHKEIMDFYHHVKPTEYEQIMRADLVSRLQHEVQKRWNDATIHPFGSFMAGLYLPTADMDIVFCSAEYLQSRRPIYSFRKHLFKFRDFLEGTGIAAPDSVEVISGAKVPIVKYVDLYTGLRVDVSFENDTGIIANKTFQDWKQTFSAMPILVTLIKQFLSMRGLNEPVNGGIGGFTVTCLVTSLLQLMPQVQSGNMIAEHHLGEMLMEFLDLYGNEFNVATTAIQFDPPGYVPKSLVRRVVYKQKDAIKFSIIDPNNPSNDISGGSANTPVILAAFAQAFKELQKQMAALNSMSIQERAGKNILGVILGGNYSSFDIQRNHLRHLHSQIQESDKE